MRQVSAKVSDDSERAHQKKLAQHRERVATLSPKDLEERMGVSLDFGTDQTLTTQCPACDADAYVGIEVEGPDDYEEGVLTGVGAFVSIVECPVCDLHMEDDELDRTSTLRTNF
jgi:hypothetical protein